MPILLCDNEIENILRLVEMDKDYYYKKIDIINQMARWLSKLP